MRADVPGVDPEDINIEVQDGVLTISGEQEHREETKEEPPPARARYGSFSRSTLPAGVDPSNIKAKTKDGVVELKIPLRRPTESR